MVFAIFDGFSHTQLFLTMSPSEEVIVNCKRQTLFTELLQEHIFGSLLWSPYVIGQTIIFLPCSFFLPSIFFFLFLA